MSDDLAGTAYTSRSRKKSPSDEIDLEMALAELKDRQLYLIGVVGCVETGHMRLQGTTLRNLHADLKQIQERFATLLPRTEILLKERD